MTPHENMLITVKALKKRKQTKQSKAEFEVKSYISSRIFKAVSSRSKRPSY
jgi:hypothetical protein